MIDLRSDTVTRPGPAMRAAMAAAEVGDDVYGEDPTVRELEARTAALLGHDAGLFVTSGTQGNLIAVLNHCRRGDEYITGSSSHSFAFEAGGAAALGGVQPHPLPFAADGSLDLDAIAGAVRPDDVHFARTRLLCLENTQSGRPLGVGYHESARRLCDARGLALHVDGARLFNAAVALAADPAALAGAADSVSVCLSKGLGAPAGSVLCGSAPFAAEARRLRKMLGGGMRQAGVLAAAGLYALDHHIDRLAEDHARAARLAAGFRQHEVLAPHVTTHTNMVFVDAPAAVLEPWYADLRHGGVVIKRPRWVVHLDVSDADIDRVLDLTRQHFRA